MDTDKNENDPWILITPVAYLAALFLAIGLIVYVTRSPEPTELEKRAEQDTRAEAYNEQVRALAQDTLADREAPLVANAKAAVLQRLRDPDSAEFGKIEVRYCRGLDCKAGDPAHGSPVVCMGVNAKNGFGGYTGFQTYILFFATHKIITPDMLNGEGIVLAGKVCLD